MSLIFRLVNGNLHRNLLAAQRCGVITLTKTQQHTRAPKCEGGTALEDHDAKNLRLNRPQSPHLTIYKPQLTAMLSISHRATGMVLASYTVLFALVSLVLPEPITSYIDDLDCLDVGEIAVMISKFLIAFPLCYHFWNGMRHLFWDMGWFLRTRQVYMTGYVMLLCAVGTATALCIL